MTTFDDNNNDGIKSLSACAEELEDILNENPVNDCPHVDDDDDARNLYTGEEVTHIPLCLTNGSDTEETNDDNNNEEEEISGVALRPPCRQDKGTLRAAIKYRVGFYTDSPCHRISCPDRWHCQATREKWHDMRKQKQDCGDCSASTEMQQVNNV